jgi:hypothetical protein
MYVCMYVYDCMYDVCDDVCSFSVISFVFIGILLQFVSIEFINA